MAELDKSVNQSTQVAFLIIEEIAAIGEPVELTQLARRLDMPKPRVFRFLKTLQSMGYVLQDRATERYRLSLKLYHLGQAVADSTQLLTEARPVMLQLRDEVGQTATFSTPEADGMRVLDMARADSPVQIVTRPGSLLDFHASAQGKVALAFGDPRYWEALERRGMAPWTPHTITDRAALEEEVARVRRQGWADAPAQALEGVNALSAPIFDGADAMVATVTIAGSVGALGTPPTDAQVDAVRRAARTISRNLGCKEYPE